MFRYRMKLAPLVVFLAMVASCKTLEEQPTPNVRDKQGYTPLHQAVQNENLAVIVALLKAGLDPNAQDKFGSTPLYHAVLSNRKPAVIVALLKAGADPNAHGKGATPSLYWAADNKTPFVAEALLKAGADPNARNSSGETPLHRAASRGSPVVVEILLKAGTNLEARNKSGMTPLHKAARFNANPAVSATLLKAGADPNVRDEFGQTPLYMAAFNVARLNIAPLSTDLVTSFTAVIVSLLKAGADPNMRDKRSGKTPLNLVFSYGYRDVVREVVEALLKGAADPNARDKDGWTPLHESVESENHRVAAILAKAGGDPNIRIGTGISGNGETALHFAACSNTNPTAIITTLLKVGADLNVRNTYDETSLHYAFKCGKSNATVVLLKAGADPNIRDFEGNRAEDVDLKNIGKIPSVREALTKAGSLGPTNRWE